MFKIGISSAPRIVPSEVTKTQESPVQQKLEQQSTPEAQPISAQNTSIRAEAKFSEFAMRSLLTQTLARNESNVNSASLKHIAPVDQLPLTQTEAEQQIENQPTYIEPFTAEEASQGEFLPKTLYTGDGDDRVEIATGYDDLVHVKVNGKEAWSGTERQFRALTIDTGKGNDVVIGSAINAKIETGEGNDYVRMVGHYNQVNTGSGDDRVEILGNLNNISTGSGNDDVHLEGNYGWGGSTRQNQVNTGSGDDVVRIDGDLNTVRTEDGNDVVELGRRADGNDIDTGQGEDRSSFPSFLRLAETGDQKANKNEELICSFGLITSPTKHSKILKRKQAFSSAMILSIPMKQCWKSFNQALQNTM